jgi:Protein of unknown function (DUF1638).
MIIGCQTLKNELNQALEDCGCRYDVSWIESGLHNTPNKLHDSLQHILDSTEDYQRVLMAMGYCGNSLTGLRTGNYTLIVPRVDDCISLLLGSHKNRMNLTRGDNTYFMTDGWLKGERNIWREYEYTINKYGEETGKIIFDMMLGNYKSLALLETGCYRVSDVEDEMKTIADTLGLRYKVLPATIEYIRKLITGPWDQDVFLSIPPYSTIKDKDLTLPI